MTQASLLYAFIHNLPIEERRKSLVQLLSLFTDEELQEVTTALRDVTTARAANSTPLKVRLNAVRGGSS